MIRLVQPLQRSELPCYCFCAAMYTDSILMAEFVQQESRIVRANELPRNIRRHRITRKLQLFIHGLIPTPRERQRTCRIAFSMPCFHGLATVENPTRPETWSKCVQCVLAEPYLCAGIRTEASVGAGEYALRGQEPQLPLRGHLPGPDSGTRDGALGKGRLGPQPTGGSRVAASLPA